MNWQGSPMAVRVPFATRPMTSALCIVPVRFAATVTPLAHVADTVPETDDDVCVVMNHLTSAQLPSGSPAIVEEPQAPLKAPAGEVVEPEPLPLPVDDDPVDAPVPVGAAGLASLVVFSKEQPVASIDATSTNKDKVFIFDLLQLCTKTHSSGI